MKRTVDHVFIWFDDKVFKDGKKSVINTQNDNLHARDAGDLPEGSRTNLRLIKPAGVMVWAAVAFDYYRSPFVFIEESVKVNTQVYIKILTEKVLPRITESFGNRYVFTEDVVSSHRSNLTQQWCNDHYSGFRNKKIVVFLNTRPDFSILSILE